MWFIKTTQGCQWKTSLNTCSRGQSQKRVTQKWITELRYRSMEEQISGNIIG